MAGALKLSFIIEAIDRATAPVRRINAVIDSVTAPIRRVRASLNSLYQESGLPRIGAAAREVGRSFGNLSGQVRGLFTSLAVGSAVALGALYPLKRVVDEFGTLNDHAATLSITA